MLAALNNSETISFYELFMRKLRRKEPNNATWLDAYEEIVKHIFVLLYSLAYSDITFTIITANKLELKANWSREKLPDAECVCVYMYKYSNNCS